MITRKATPEQIAATNEIIVKDMTLILKSSKINLSDTSNVRALLAEKGFDERDIDELSPRAVEAALSEGAQE